MVVNRWISPVLCWLLASLVAARAEPPRLPSGKRGITRSAKAPTRSHLPRSPTGTLTPDDYAFVHPLVPPFLVLGGTLAVGQRRISSHGAQLLWYVPTHALPRERSGGTGRPAGEAKSERSFSIEIPQCRQLGSLNELRGLVRLRTPEEALSFVRLDTFPCWCIYRPKPAGQKRSRTRRYVYAGVEPIVRERVTIVDTYGQKGTLREMRRYSGGTLCVVSAHEAGQLGVGDARVSRRGEGYEVVRVLVRLKPPYQEGHDRLVRVREWVSPDGEYRMELQVPLPMPKAPGLNWFVPLN